MRILVLSCNTGQGHNSTAKSVMQNFTDNKVECVTHDALKFVSKSFSDFICSWHVRIYRYAPVLFEHGYDFAERHPIFAKDTPLYILLTSGVKKLEKLVVNGKFTGIICTHPFAALMVAEMLNRYDHPGLKTAIIATDYTCSPGFSEAKLDAYFIPHKRLTNDFIDCGCPKEKIIASGIPVSKEFYSHVDKNEAKARFDIKPEQKHVLMMCGSIGCGPMAELAENLSRKLPKNAVLTVVCGTNKKLEAKLEKFKGPRVRVYGFTNEVPTLMDSADIYLTKAGGLSTTEAAVKGLPIVFIDAISGCEAYNKHFFVSEGLGFAASEDETVTEVCLGALKNPGQLEAISKRMRAEFPENPAKQIYDFFKE